jgi:branched-chain amino acid transport system permease protein
MTEQVLVRPFYRSKYVWLGLILLFLLVFPVVQFIFEKNFNFYFHMMLTAFLYISMSSSWNILGGYAGYVSLGHNVFMAVGAYFSGALFAFYGIPVFLSAPVAGLVAMAVAFLVGFITLRVRGPAFIISTIALVLVFRIVLDNWAKVGGANGMSLTPLDLGDVRYVKFPFYYGMLILAMVTVFSSFRIRHSKLGLALRAISQNETKAESAGIPTAYYKILAFAISGFFVGVAGSMWGYYLTYLRPSIFLIILVGARMVLMSILGGKGTVAGPVVGVVIIILVEEMSNRLLGSSELNIALIGTVLASVLIFFPDGLVGSLRNAGKLPAILDWD